MRYKTPPYLQITKHIGKSKYKYIYIAKIGEDTVYTLTVNNKKYGKIQKRFTDEKDAAMYLDKILIQKGFEPINILKRK